MAEQQSTQELGFDPDALRAKYREERDKRLRSDGNAQYFEVKGDFSRYVDDPYIAPGTGTAIPAQPATWSPTSTCRYAKN